MTRLGDLFRELGAFKDWLKNSKAEAPDKAQEKSQGRRRDTPKVKVTIKKNRTGSIPEADRRRPAPPVGGATRAGTGRGCGRDGNADPRADSGSGRPSPPRDRGPAPRPAAPQPPPRPRPAPPPPAENRPAAPAPESLWADPARLVIRARRALSREASWDVCDPTSSGTLAVVGLDFGTAFTKAVVRFEGYDYAVDWSDAVATGAEDRYLLPTCLSESTGGRVLLGANDGPGWALRNGIKMAVMHQPAGGADRQAIETAVLFVAAAFRYVQWWTRRNVPRTARAEIRWRLHLGVPSVADDAMEDVFRDIGGRAYRVAMQPGPLARTAIEPLGKPVDQVLVLPELSAQMSAYHGSHQRQTDLHAMLDVGAGTLDCVFFLDHRNEVEGDVIGQLAARVEPLGIHRLLAALVGKAGESREWEDADAALKDEVIASTIGEPARHVSGRRSDYRQRVDGAFYQTWRASRALYDSGPVHRGEKPLRVFLTGGGSRNERIRRAVDRLLSRHFVRQRWIGSYHLTDLPAPTRERFEYDGSDYHRMAVAHGLCEMRRGLGVYRRQPDGDPVLAPLPELRDRDEDR